MMNSNTCPFTCLDHKHCNPPFKLCVIVFLCYNNLEWRDVHHEEINSQYLTETMKTDMYVSNKRYNPWTK